MAKFWCINCQDEVEHRADYCHSRCGNDCDQFCSRCNRKTLTTTADKSDPRDSEAAVIKWATGAAQRQSKLTGKTGEIEIEVERPDYKFCAAIYNTENNSTRLVY